MKFDFDQIQNRRGTSCVKWDASDRIYGGTDLLPMWIADMDFATAPGIQEEIIRRTQRGIFGYGMLPQEYYDAVIGWMDRRHHCHVEKDWICFSSSVVAGLRTAVRAATEPGDEIIVFSPVYGPFYSSVTELGRVLVTSPLKEQDLYYTMDLEDLEAKITPRTRAVMLCSPHNPVGRVWTKEELSRLADFCLKHGLTVIADEIHNDLVFKEHTMFLNVSPEIAMQTILCTAPTKTFNLAGVQVSNTIIPNEALRKKFKAVMLADHASSANAFAAAALIGAYNHSEDWLDQLLPYLEGNVDLFCSTIQKELPQLRVRKPEGTYLVWVDCSALGLDADGLKQFMVQKCGLALSMGIGFGDAGAQFARFNLACPRAHVEECLRRLKEGCAK